MKTLVTVLGLIALALIMTVVDYWMISKIYSHALLPLGAPQLTLIQIWGIGLFINALANIPSQRVDERNTSEKIADAAHKSLLIAFFWFLSWAVLG